MKMLGKSMFLVMITVSVCFSQSETLTNEKVIKMAQAGISEQLILKKIESDLPGFDLSADALIALKKAGVPDSVIEAMFNSAGASNSPYQEPGFEARQTSSVIVYPAQKENVSRIVLGKSEALRSARTIAIKKSSLHPSRQSLEKELFKRADWRALNLNIVRLKEDADLYVEIGYVSMSWITHRYVYRVYESKSGTIIIAGETTSWGSLAKNLARGISKRLKQEMDAARNTG